MKSKKTGIAGLLCLIAASAGSSWGSTLESLGKALQADQNTGAAWNELYDASGFGGAKSEAGAVAAGNASAKTGASLTAGRQGLSQAAAADVPSPPPDDVNDKKGPREKSSFQKGWDAAMRPAKEMVNGGDTGGNPIIAFFGFWVYLGSIPVALAVGFISSVLNL